MTSSLLGLLTTLSITFAVCTSTNAPGTPDGSECKCEASGPNAECYETNHNTVACITDNSEEICEWGEAGGGGSGCLCTTEVDDLEPGEATQR